jgi:hypothetical protein
MKRIVKYTLGWDMEGKEGYLTAIDETQTSHIFGKLHQLEFQLLINMLNQKKVFIDNNKWIISGWDKESY